MSTINEAVVDNTDEMEMDTYIDTEEENTRYKAVATGINVLVGIAAGYGIVSVVKDVRRMLKERRMRTLIGNIPNHGWVKPSFKFKRKRIDELQGIMTDTAEEIVEEVVEETQSEDK